MGLGGPVLIAIILPMKKITDHLVGGLGLGGEGGFGRGGPVRTPILVSPSWTLKLSD